MKRLILSCFLGIMLMFTGIFFGCSMTNYYFDYENINTNVAYNSDLSLEDWYFIKKAGKEETKVYITEDMIVSCGSTDTLGDKKIVLNYDGIEIVVNFSVKYRIDFKVNDEIYNTQYVLNSDEIVFPEAPVVEGYSFATWAQLTPQTLTDNFTFDAQLTVLATGMPKLLSSYSATYEDTLAQISLPQNPNGKWTFKDSLDTKVGNVGEHIFVAQFIPTDKNLVPTEQEVKINVLKKNVEFTSIVKEFSYDGTVKVPTFDLSVPNLRTDYEPYYVGDAKDVGEYEFDIEIIDKNYKGLYSGIMKINPVKATINIDSLQVDFDEEYPSNFTYNVKNESGEPLDENLKELMGIELVKPTYLHTGEYKIDAIVSNKNFITTINVGWLTVNKVEHDLTDTEIVFTTGGNNITYGDSLGSIIFGETDIRGTWSWENPDFVVLDTAPFEATAVFTPNELQDYLPSTRKVALTVVKRILTINITKNEYTYDGNEHTIEYTLSNVVAKDEGDVTIVGNITKTNADTYAASLSVESSDLRYVALTHTSLIINKASSSDFTTVYTKQWNRALTLSDIEIDSHYVWVNPDTQVTELGEQKYFATYTPDDTENYEVETEELTINIIKATASVTALENYAFTYNAIGYELNNVIRSHTESSITYSYVYTAKDADPVSVTKIDNAGVYAVTITLPESAHYNEATTTTTVTINQVENKDEVTKTQTSEYGMLLSRYALPTSSFGTWAWEKGASSTVGNAGTVVNKAIFTPFNEYKVNYAGRIVEVTFTIAKKSVGKPTITAKKYTGDTLTADVEENTLYNVDTNAGGIDVGGYDVIISLADSNNYCWADEDVNTATIIMEFEITLNDANYWVTNPQVCESFTYGQGMFRHMEGEPKYYDEDNLVAVSFKLKGTDTFVPWPESAGDYVVIFSVASTENYTGLTFTTEFSILPVSVHAPEKIADFDWNGELQKPTFTNSYYTVPEETNLGGINVGTYSVKLVLIGTNYKWDDGTVGLEKTLYYNINPKTDNEWLIGEEPTITGWTYTSQGGTAGTATSKYGTPIIEYKLLSAPDTAYSTTLPVNAGTYVARFRVEEPETGNYNAIDGENATEIEFIIAKASSNLVAPVYDLSVVRYENTITDENIDEIYSRAPEVGATVLAEGGGTYTYQRPVLIGTNTANQDWEEVTFNVTFTPKSANFATETVTTKIRLYKVAHIGDTYYGSIETAVEKAISGNVVMVIPNISGNVTIANPITIKSGVTLTLPYRNAAGNEEVNANSTATTKPTKSDVNNLPADYSYAFEVAQLTSKVIVKTGVVITNNGIITIAGELGVSTHGGNNTPPAEHTKKFGYHSGFSGHTARYYAKFVLENGAQIVNNTGSVVNCYGYIDEVENDSTKLVDQEGNYIGAQVIVNSGASLYMPFIIGDFCGGTYMAGCASDSKDISPFNRYEVRNVLPLMTVRYGGKVYAWANMYFSTLDRWLTTTINFVGTEDESVFQMKDSINSCVTVKHTIKDANRSVDKEDWLYGVTKIDVYGDGQLNGMKIKINMIVDYNINTADFTLPLPYSFNIGIHKGNFHLKNKIKLLPGSEVFIDSDAVVNIDNLTVTSSAWTDSITFTTNELIKVPYNKNVKNLPPAKLIVNGTLIATALGGTVTTTSNTAEITVTTPSCIIYEPKKGGKEGWLVKSFKVSEYHEDGTSLSLVYQNADGTTKTPVSITAGGTYNSSSGDWVSGALPQN